MGWLHFPLCEWSMMDLVCPPEHDEAAWGS